MAGPCVNYSVIPPSDNIPVPDQLRSDSSAASAWCQAQFRLAGHQDAVCKSGSTACVFKPVAAALPFYSYVYDPKINTLVCIVNNKTSFTSQVGVTACG